MSKALKLTFDTAESTKTITITNPKEDVTQDECKDAMEAIVESGAFDGLEAPVKAVMYESDSEIIYEA